MGSLLEHAADVEPPEHRRGHGALRQRGTTATSPGRLFCHVYGRGKGQAQMIGRFRDRANEA